MLKHVKLSYLKRVTFVVNNTTSITSVLSVQYTSNNFRKIGKTVQNSPLKKTNIMLLQQLHHENLQVIYM